MGAFTEKQHSERRHERFTRLLELRSVLIDRATGVEPGDQPSRYAMLRTELMKDPDVGPRLPSYVRTSFTIRDFWAFIQPKLDSYKERREFLIAEFQPLLQVYDDTPAGPLDASTSEGLQRVDWPNVQDAWKKALARRSTDPDGALTTARSLLETVCKHILEPGEYTRKDDLPKLYYAASKKLKLAPDQHVENAIKQILGGCVSVVNGMASLRNEMGDAHGKPASQYRPTPRHAELAVNLAGSLASFLVATWEVRSKSTSG